MPIRKKLAIIFGAMFAVGGLTFIALMGAAVNGHYEGVGTPSTPLISSSQSGSLPGGAVVSSSVPSGGGYPDRESYTYRGNTNGLEAYALDWLFTLGPNEKLTVDVGSVNVVVNPYAGSELVVYFDGYRSSKNQNFQPELRAYSTSGGVTIEQIYRSSTGWNFGSYNDTMVGQLAVWVPDSFRGHLAVDTYSGNIGVADLGLVSIALDASSGNISVSDTTVSDSASYDTFSGNVELIDTTGASVDIGTSSGKATVDGLRAGTLDINTFSGSHTLKGLDIEGRLDLGSSSGKIELSNYRAASLDVSAFSGNVSLTDGAIAGDLAVNTSSGKITLTDMTCGDLNLDSFSGNVEVKGTTSGPIEVGTSSGKVELTLGHMVDIEVGTFSGNVTLIVPKEAQPRLDLSTFSGTFTVGFPVTLDAGQEAKSLLGTVGAGTSKVAVSTSSGNVTIKPAD